MAQEIAPIIMIAVVGATLAALGIVGMLVANRFKERRLECFLQSKELSAEWLAAASLTHSLRELALGLLITLVVPIFTHFCLIGSASTTVSIIVGYLAAVLCSLGCFSRQRHDMESLGIGNEANTLKRILAFFAVSLALFLWGMLSLYVAIFFFLQQR